MKHMRERPSFLEAARPLFWQEKSWQAILDEVVPAASFASDAEITVECNPGTLNRKKLENYKAAGVNRLSIGLQSADNRELKILGRIHTWEQFRENYALVRELGFSNVNIDLMSRLARTDQGGLAVHASEGHGARSGAYFRLQPDYRGGYALLRKIQGERRRESELPGEGSGSDHV